MDGDTEREEKMYKKLTAVLAITALAGMLSNVHAQENTLPDLPEPSSKSFTMLTSIACDTKEAMSNVIFKKYGEHQFTQGNGQMTVMVNPQGTILPGVVKLWANPETWTFSITIEDPNPNNDVMCLLTSGVQLKPTGSTIKKEEDL
tara:strand:- start:95 stop:532 length:438 start_codon:yes stop_codon:yes gene_type:complete